jgi:hypothetical protein
MRKIIALPMFAAALLAATAVSAQTGGQMSNPSSAPAQQGTTTSTGTDGVGTPNNAPGTTGENQTCSAGAGCTIPGKVGSSPDQDAATSATPPGAAGGGTN